MTFSWLKYRQPPAILNPLKHSNLDLGIGNIKVSTSSQKGGANKLLLFSTIAMHYLCKTKLLVIVAIPDAWFKKFKAVLSAVSIVFVFAKISAITLFFLMACSQDNENNSRENLLQAEKFLASNLNNTAVVEIEAGLQYTVLESSESSRVPNLDSTITADFHGTLIDGSVFWSSIPSLMELQVRYRCCYWLQLDYALQLPFKGWTPGLLHQITENKISPHTTSFL